MPFVAMGWCPRVEDRNGNNDTDRAEILVAILEIWTERRNPALAKVDKEEE
jgi:hypothetical protein